MLRPASSSTLFPYTTLFRSYRENEVVLSDRVHIRALVRRLRHDPFSSYRRPDHVADFVGRQTSARMRSEEHTSELQSQFHLVCRLLLEKKKRQRLETRGPRH